MIYYISDTHFYHSNIINLANRPFKDIDLMKQVLIDNWNTTVTNNDTVYFLGDFSFKCNQQTSIELLKQLNGKKYFIKGNHDKENWLNKIKEQGLIEDWYSYKEINDNNRMVILCHYPLHSWNGLYHGSYHLYGHVHQNTVENEDWQKNRFNVSCEVLDYTPRTLDQLICLNKIDMFLKDKSNNNITIRLNSIDDLNKTIVISTPEMTIDDLTLEQRIKNCEDKIWDDFWKNVCYEIDPDFIKEL